MRNREVKIKQCVHVNGDLVHAFREWCWGHRMNAPTAQAAARWDLVIWDTHKSKLDPKLLAIMLMERAGFQGCDPQGCYGFQLRPEERPSTNHAW